MELKVNFSANNHGTVLSKSLQHLRSIYLVFQDAIFEVKLKFFRHSDGLVRMNNNILTHHRGGDHLIPLISYLCCEYSLRNKSY